MTANERQRFIEALDSAGMKLNMVIDGVDDTPPSELLAMLRGAESKIQRARKVIDRRCSMTGAMLRSGGRHG